MTKSYLKIGFIGAGSIGSLFGGYLASIANEKYKIEIIFFCRKKHAEAINNNGLKLQIGENLKTIKNIRAFESLQKMEEKERNSDEIIFNFLFLTTKTYDIENAMIQYSKIINSCGRLVILQNGIGNEDIIQESCKKEKIIRIVTSNGALLEEPGYIIHTGKGYTKIGAPFIKAQKINEEEIIELKNDLKFLTILLNKSGLITDLVNDIIKESWEKVFVNIGINPFGALTRLKNGELLRIEGLKKLMGAAVEEAVFIAKKMNIDLTNDDYIALTYDVAEKTFENKNSMLQDVLKGKKTEIDFINGKIVNYAKDLNINVPINDILTFLIKGLEKSYN